jgi:PAS domain S-box-containing protein
MCIASTMGSIGDAVIVMDAGLRIEFLNGLAEALTGWTLAEARGRKARDIVEIIEEGCGARPSNALATALAEGTIVAHDGPYQLTPRSGKKIPVTHMAAPMRDERGNIVGAVLIFRDTTKERLREGILKQQAELIEIVHDAVMTRDLEGKISFWNRAAETKYGFSRAEAIGRRASDLLGTVFPKPLAEIEAVLQRDGLWEGELAQTTKAGRQIVVESRWATQKDALGGTVFVIEINRDITERKRAERAIGENARQLTAAKRAAEAASTAKSEFLAMMSHEIRTPLAAIMGFAELLVQPGQAFGEKRDFGQRIRRNGELLVRIIDDILDLSKVEAGKLTLEHIEFNLPQALTDIAEVMHLLASERGLSFSMGAEGPLPDAIVSDPTRLKQILSNIIGNAIKFTSRGFVDVKIRARQPDKLIYFEVRDTGPGLSREQALKVFEPFAQADASVTRKHGGTGLGLSLARRLAQALGGDVRLLESEEGKGSVFEVAIAAHGARYDAPPPPKIEAEAEGRLDGIRVLVADDSIDNQRLVARFLAAAGANIEVADDGEIAAQKAMRDPFDVVLMDVRMPKVDGLEATRTLRKLGYLGPIVALTAHAMRDDIERCRQAGCDRHLAKPFQRSELIEVVRQIACKH